MTIEIVRDSHLLSSLSSEHIEFLESVATEFEFDPGSVIFADDDPAETFYVIASGKVALEVEHATGSSVIETLGPRDLLGVSWLFPPARWNWTARAVGATRAVGFVAQRVRTRCEEDRVFALHIYQTVAGEAVRRLHATRIRLLDIYAGAER